MGEAIEGLRAHGDARKILRQQEGATRKVRATETFVEAMALAINHDMKLTQVNTNHYQLRGIGGWLINIYPSTARLSADRRHPKAPRLLVSGEWSLVNIVTAALDPESTP